MFHAFTPRPFVAAVAGLAALVSAHPLTAGAGVTCAEVATATAHDESPIHPPTAVWPPFARSPRRVASVRIDPVSPGVGSWSTFGPGGPNTKRVADEITLPLQRPPAWPAEESGRERAVFTGAGGTGKYTAEAETYAARCPGGGRATGRHTDGSGLAPAPSRTRDTRHPVPPPSSVWVGLLTLGGLAVAQACGWRAGCPRRVRS